MKQKLYRVSAYGIVLLFLSISFFSSCSKEDNIAPVITSVNFKMNDTIRNIFNIKVDATDNTGIDRLELLANDSLIGQVNEAPFEYLWNTTEMKDGQYVLRAIIYDSNGNKAESAYSVLIQNALLTVNLGSEYHDPVTFVISDEQGVILKSVTFEGTGIRMIMPDTPLENNAINVMYRFSVSIFTGITSFIHVERGSEFNMDWKSFGPVAKGVKLHLKNDIGSFSRIWLCTDLWSFQLTSMADTANLPNTIIYNPGHKLFLQIETNEVRYYKFLTIDNIEEITVKLSDINSGMTVKSYSLPPTRGSSYFLMGKGNDADSINRYYISQAHTALNENHFDILYPPEYFSKYYTYVSYSPIEDNNKSYSNIYQGAVPDRFDPLTAEFDIINSKTDNFKANISGDFDFYQIAYYDPTQTVEFSVSAPVNQKEWKLPDPATAFDNPNYIFDKWSFVFLENQGSLDWTHEYYDVSIDFENLNYYAEYSQSMWINNPLAKANKIQFPSTFIGMHDPLRKQIRNF